MCFGSGNAHCRGVRVSIPSRPWFERQRSAKGPPKPFVPATRLPSDRGVHTAKRMIWESTYQVFPKAIIPRRCGPHVSDFSTTLHTCIDTLDCCIPGAHTNHHCRVRAVTEQQRHNHQQIVPPEASSCDSSGDKSHYNEQSRQDYQSYASGYHSWAVVGVQVNPSRGSQGRHVFGRGAYGPHSRTRKSYYDPFLWSRGDERNPMPGRMDY